MMDPNEGIFYASEFFSEHDDALKSSTDYDKEKFITQVHGRNLDIEGTRIVIYVLMVWQRVVPLRE